jgi:uncharacterized protein
LTLAALGGAGVVCLAAFVKGAIGFGFPTLATPLLALFLDVPTAVVITILPNIVMDGILTVRRGTADLAAVARRLGVLIAFGAGGMIAGTRLLVVLPAWLATLILGLFVLAFVVVNTTRWALRVPAGWEPWLSPPIGLLAGVVGGITNVPGTLLVIYYYALGMGKDEFVRSVAVSFLLYKLVQLGAVTGFGLLDGRLFGISVLLTVVGLGAFRLGLAVQDRLDQRMFNRAVLAFLTLLGTSLILRALL